MATEKTKAETVDQYIAAFPANIQAILTEIRETIRKAVPDAEEVISYSIPAYKYHGGWVLYFSVYTNHFSLSCPPPFTVFDVFKEELAPYKQSKSAIQFPLKDGVPVQLITNIAKFRAKECFEVEQVKLAAKQSKAKK